MILYHRTSAADAILRDGFKDTTGYYLTSTEYNGVWFSDVPLDGNEGADGDMLLAVEIPEEVIAEYEWIEEGKPYREWLIPADLVNSYDPPVVVEAI
jgi:hypothetical protein